MARERRLEAALGPAFDAGPVPTNGRELVRYAGGRRALTQQLAGMDGAPRRADYKDPAAYEAARRTWRTASQRALRYDKEQRVSPAVSRGTKARIKRAATAAKRSLVAERGLRARMFAKVTVPSPGPGKAPDTRDRVMPSGGPGVFIDGASVREVLDRIGDRDLGEAAGEFEEAFWAAFGMPDQAEIVSVSWIKLWPDGEREPA